MAKCCYSRHPNFKVGKYFLLHHMMIVFALSPINEWIPLDISFHRCLCTLDNRYSEYTVYVQCFSSVLFFFAFTGFLGSSIDFSTFFVTSPFLLSKLTLHRNVRTLFVLQNILVKGLKEKEKKNITLLQQIKIGENESFRVFMLTLILLCIMTYNIFTSLKPISSTRFYFTHVYVMSCIHTKSRST